jgi:protease I
VRHLEPAEGTRGDRLIAEASPDEYDALLVPGGLASPDMMRQSDDHLGYVEEFVTSGKPVFAICHGPWLLADSGVAQGRTLTSWPGIRYDMERAGAEWVDEPVVVDGNLVTSRKPDDIPAFIEGIFDQLRDLARPPLRHAA